MSAVLTRKFGEETVQFLGKKVSVETSDQKTYNGTLTGTRRETRCGFGECGESWNH